MSDVYLKDSKGRYHQVCIQATSMSCGPACVAMVERIYKHRPGSDEARACALSQRYPGSWSMEEGTMMYNLSSVLNAIGVGAYASTNVGTGNVYAYLKYYACFATPVIARIQWNGCGHFVVFAIYDTDDTFVAYDPFYGLVEVPGRKLPEYIGVDSKGPAQGHLSGHLVITHQ